MLKTKKNQQERAFPYCSSVVESGDTNPADFLLACTTRGVCDAYQNVILKIPRLSANSTKQLITDVGKSALTILRDMYMVHEDFTPEMELFTVGTL